MSSIKLPRPVKYFCGFIHTQDVDFKAVLDRLVQKLGPWDMVSKPVPFTFTDYYKEEMGQDLIRRFASFKNLMDPAVLPDVRLFTLRVEEEFGNKEGEELYRKVNIDPGYLSFGKVVLSTTKNFSHRIYIRDGIYAEVTLAYQKGNFKIFEYTYPDYQSEFALDYFTKLRSVYKTQVHSKDYGPV